MEIKPPPKGVGGGSNSKSTGRTEDRPAAAALQDQLCAACGSPGQPPVIGAPQPTDLTIKPFLGRLALLCRECITVAALERAIRRPRP